MFQSEAQFRAGKCLVRRGDNVVCYHFKKGHVRDLYSSREIERDFRKGSCEKDNDRFDSLFEIYQKGGQDGVYIGRMLVVMSI